MRAVALLILTVVFAAGCASTSVPTPEPVKRSVIVAGTLSTNECEAMTAAAYTRLIVDARRAESRVRSGTLDVTTATEVLSLGRAAREDLDLACVGGQLDRARLARAVARLDHIRNLVGR